MRPWLLAAVCWLVAVPAAADTLRVRGQLLGPQGPAVGLLRVFRHPHSPSSEAGADPYAEIATVETAADGSFTVELARDPGRRRDAWAIAAEAPGMARRWLRVPREGGRPLARSELLGGVRLERGRTVHGRIDGGSEPLAGLRVSLWPQAGDLVPEPWLATLERGGGWRVDGVAPGIYTLVADRGGVPVAWAEGCEVPRDASSEPAAVDWGVIEAVPRAPLRGRVVDPAGEAVAAAEVRIDWRLPAVVLDAWLRRPAVASDDAGWFELTAARDGRAVHLAVEREGYRPHHGEAATDTDPAGVRRLAAPLVLEPMVELRGRVVDALGRPIPGAELTPTRAGERAHVIASYPAEPDGSFRLWLRAPGPYRLRVRAPGYASLETEVEVASADPADEGLTLVLEPVDATDLTLTVRDSDDGPVAGADVWLHSQATDYSAAERTGGDGRLVLAAVPLGGPYSLEIRHPDHLGYSRPRLEIGETRLDVRLDPPPWRLVTLIGTVADIAGRPLGGAEVTLAGERSPGYAGATDGAGRYAIERVREGVYTATATAPGLAPTLVRVSVHEDPHQLDLTLDEGATLSGVVRGLPPAALRGLGILAQAEASSLEARAVAAPDGSFRLEHLASGRWLVGAWHQGTGAEESVEIASGQGRASVELRFPTRHRVAGRVLVDGEPGGGLGVQLDAAASPGPARYYTARTGADGRFLFDLVAAGAYELRVHTSHGYPGRAVEVSSDLELEIALRTGWVRGRVVDDAGGEPLAEVRVEATPPSSVSHGPRWQAVSGADGWFEIGPLAEGRWFLLAERDGFRRGTLGLQVEAAGPPPVEIRLTAKQGLAVRVTTATGRRPLGVELELFGRHARPVAQGYASLDESGSGLWDGAPPGRWRLRASDRLSWTWAEVEIPGPPAALHFAAAGSLVVRIPELELTGEAARRPGRPSLGLAYRATLEAPDDPSYDGPAERRGDGPWLRGLTPGSWRVEAEAEDGRTWSGTARVIDGERIEVLLR